jgi:uncharacterized phiE125 gp8 family phage protein
VIKIERTTDPGLAVPVCVLLEHCNAADYDSDLLEAYSAAAQELVEERTGRILTSTTYQLYLDGMPPKDFRFPFFPINTVDEVAYKSDVETWTVVDIADYHLGRGNQAFQTLTAVDSWPEPYDGEDTYRITCTAGAPNNRASQAVRMLAANWYANREAVGTTEKELPFAVEWLIRSLKLYD